MLMIRLQRIGKKHDPSYRIALIDSRRATKSGAFLENLGSYNPQKGKPAIKAEAILARVKQGARLSPTVSNLLVKQGVLNAKKIDVLRHNRIKAKKEKKGSAKPVEAA